MPITPPVSLTPTPEPTVRKVDELRDQIGGLLRELQKERPEPPQLLEQRPPAPAPGPATPPTERPTDSHPPSDAPRPEPISAVAPVPTPGAGHAEGLPLLYLEERIELATRAAAELGRELQASAGTPSSGQVGRVLLGLVLELQRATEELKFLRSNASPGFDVPPADPAAPQGRDEAKPRGLADRPARVDQGEPPPGAENLATPGFIEYTTNRYDATIVGLEARKGRLLGWTVGFAVAIGAALLAANFVAHEPTPALWFALLPLVWLIPVPFFLLAFRGTLRTLGTKRLEIEARN